MAKVLVRLPSPANLYRTVAVLASLALVAAAAGWLGQGYALLQERGSDAVWQFAGARTTPQDLRVVIVDIDENSLAREGAWPWPRERLAALAEALERAGAQVQLFDIVFPEARQGDSLFAERLAQGNAHVGQVFSFKPDAGRVGALSGALTSAACAPIVPVAGGYVGNTPSLALAAGHITPTIDGDGTVRRIAPLICHQHRAYPVLALQAIQSLSGEGVEPQLLLGRSALSPAAWLSYPQLGLRIPLDADGNTRLPFAQSDRAYVSVSASDLLAGRAPSGLFEGVIALVGTTAFGLGDTVPTPVSSLTPGVEVHARMLSAMLDNALPYTPQIAPLLQAAAIAVSALLLLLLATRARRLHAYALPLAGAMLAVSIYLVHAYLLIAQGWWLGWLGPSAFAALAGASMSAAEFAATRRERERLYRNLVSYLPRNVAEQVALREPVGAIEAERKEVTILFADLRNASAYFEARPPEEVGALLHAFFTTAHRVVQSNGGGVEEFFGDSIMAVWESNDQSSQPCDSTSQFRALAAAQALVLEVSRLLPETPPPGLEPLAIGVGIETGPALVGSFGAAERRTHAVLGETVTVAARVQAMTVELATPIVLGEGFAQRFLHNSHPDHSLRDAGCFLLEGLQRPRHLFVLCEPGDIADNPVRGAGDGSQDVQHDHAPRIRRVV